MYTNWYNHTQTGRNYKKKEQKGTWSEKDMVAANQAAEIAQMKVNGVDSILEFKKNSTKPCDRESEN